MIAVLLTACASLESERAFTIALIGDLPYSEAKNIEAKNLMDDLNAHEELAFVIHDGDFKGGKVPCNDAIYADRLATFQNSAHPMFFIFGDNEWTDCHRSEAGSYNPFERLGLLRRLFANFSEQNSFGKTKLPLVRQSTDFPENVRWFYHDVLFVGLHMPGSNNGLDTGAQFTKQAKTEYAARNAANLAWLHEAFAIAVQKHSPGILITIQANPWDLIPAERLTGYEDFLVALERETRAFKKPVVLVHGDSHYFRIDKPLPSALPSQVQNTALPFILPVESDEPRLTNFTRVETFGHPNSHWVKVTIDENNPNLFSFEAMIVKKNRNNF